MGEKFCSSLDFNIINFYHNVENFHSFAFDKYKNNCFVYNIGTQNRTYKISIIGKSFHGL